MHFQYKPLAVTSFSGLDAKYNDLLQKTTHQSVLIESWWKQFFFFSNLEILQHLVNLTLWEKWDL